METGAGGIEEILRVRKDKADRLAEQGWPSYPSGLEVRHSTLDVVSAEGEAPGEPAEGDPQFRVAGRLMAVRGMGKAMFCDLWDRAGKIQIQIRKDLVGEEIVLPAGTFALDCL